MRVTILGIGLLGRAVAERLHDSGHAVTVYNRTASKTDPLRAHGITVAATAAEAVASTDCTLLYLTDAAAIHAVLFPPAAPVDLRSRTIIQMGTISPDESRAFQRSVSAGGGDYFEAPVLGSLAEAKAGTLIIMGGGTADQLRRWEPVFSSLTPAPFLIGPIGQAAALKLALNHLIAAELSAFALSLGLIQRAGISVDQFMTILKSSALFAPAFEKKLPRLLARQYDKPNFPTSHLLKDVNLFADDARHHGLNIAGLTGVRALLEHAIQTGQRDADYSALFESINPRD
ncbi:NAD(P)-dependent oxidoreductase [Nitrospira lenta]|uniref:3-hydroxyacid dehydrogenase n=1 Tax=Nitrospira lenta TaxID=1436998 RepID=A0A330L5I6_9BACT|nr:NAD(P)-dependent oxidoreductase [Nitrospira lenta]SPP64590.1 3-hydroxyacid dehydrogenase [Nitrospira lenta]